MCDYTYIYIYMYIYIYVYIYIYNIYMYICTYTYIHAHTHKNVPVTRLLSIYMSVWKEFQPEEFPAKSLVALMLAEESSDIGWQL